MERKKPSTQEDKEKKEDDLARPAGQRPPIDPLVDSGSNLRGPPIVNIGRADLDPFAGGVGGGMIFDPNDPSHFIQPNRPQFPGMGHFPSPSGMIPQPPLGARFDPFGPGGTPGRGLRGARPRGGGGHFQGPGRGPDNDHMRPDGWDDAFM
ncbi:uncharacterized protein LOC128386832 [Panonychus citri]|uniref:uncharacterized protein LOC128386832 n=1 Tax=Panonychus citri TaxID=50023 RepID=UPI0023074D95|nr:uncharacterized protein LOC128386832 [Panonychus citri]